MWLFFVAWLAPRGDFRGVAWRGISTFLCLGAGVRVWVCQRDVCPISV
jgi:hypothetical protein